MSDSIPVDERVAHSHDAWRQLGRTIASITPKQAARLALGIAAIIAVIWIIVASWPSLVPFAIGGVIAYTMLPFVNALDKVLPRVLAALIGVLVPLVVIAGLIYIIVPPLITELLRLIDALPDEAQIAAITGAIGADLRFQELPAIVQRQSLGIVSSALLRARDGAEGILPGIIGVRPFAAAANVLTSILGLLVLPTWTLTLLKDQPRAWPSVAGIFPPGARRDVRAYVRIVDRAFGNFLRGQVVVGLAVGLATYLGLYLLDYYTTIDIQYKMPLAVLAGLLQLIPEVGPIVNIIGVTLLAWFAHGRLPALEILALYLVIQWITGKLVADRFQSRMFDLHPAALVLVIVALSQLGPLFFFLAAPFASVARDIWRYTFGRLKEPSLPAGIIPAERSVYERRLAQQQAAAARPLPSVYRRR